MKPIKLLHYIPEDLAESEDTYVALPGHHWCIPLAETTISKIADVIESCISPREPYEISIVGLKTSGPALMPVWLIGTERPDRLHEALLKTDLIFKTRVRQCYPASLSNNVDRNTNCSDVSMIKQVDVPCIGTSCGAIMDDRHTASLGAYIALSSLPRKICILTVPPTHLPLPQGTIISQPSIADREQQHLTEDDPNRVVLNVNAEQVAAIRQEQEKTFEFARVIASSTFPLKATTDTAGDRVAPTSTSIDETIISHSSCTWALAEVTRCTTIQTVSEKKRKMTPTFKTLKPTTVCDPEPEMIVSKQGRTTQRTIGTVNAVKSLYRLPRDGLGVRRRDYVVLSHPWGGVFGLPGDAGAIVMAHTPKEIGDNKQIREVGKPCGMVVAASTSQHMTYIQSLVDVTTDIENQGFGTVTIIKVNR
ncbi:hypothetical protein Clacol_008679 [Clathrus columnatus]|uniref:Uncharacterized protein n=1 Tax=Clathrus columnatus TaxID=1419009 RepID=A0AAV5AJ70_9AGAM|nr:hypothetical protein Clacol_008679 [Clathrus columnatus]